MKTTLIYFVVFIGLSCIANAQWTQVGDDIDGEAVYDEAGYNVCINGDGSIVAVGAPYNDDGGTDAGHVRVFENISGVWTQIGADIDGETTDDMFGVWTSLSSDGSILAIGANHNSSNGASAGHVKIFENVGGAWTQIGNNIEGEAAGDQSGYNVDLSADGSVVAIGAPKNDENGTDAGHVRVFENISGTWTQVGLDIDGEAAGDNSGWALSLSDDGSIVAIAAPNNAGNRANIGHVRAYENISGDWVQLGGDIDGENNEDLFGTAMSMNASGTRVAIGGYLNDGAATNAGHTKVYEYSAGNWVQMGSDIDGEFANDYSGGALSINGVGDLLAITALTHDGTGTDAGDVRIFEYSGSEWVQVGVAIDGEAINDLSGWSVRLSPDNPVVVIGAKFNDGNDGFNSHRGHARVYEYTTVGVQNVLSEANFSFYPNPTTGIINVNTTEHTRIQIIDIHGQIVFEGNGNEIDLSGEAKGIYMLKFTNESSVSIEKLILK